MNKQKSLTVHRDKTIGKRGIEMTNRFRATNSPAVSFDLELRPKRRNLSDIDSVYSRRSMRSGKTNKSVVEALKLNNYEVCISFLRFCIGSGIFTRPYFYSQFGLSNCFAVEIISVGMGYYSFKCLIDCMMFLPVDYYRPNTKVTYGKVVSYILDQRTERINKIRDLNSIHDSSTFKVQENKGTFGKILDVCVFTSQIILMVQYQKTIKLNLIQIF